MTDKNEELEQTIQRFLRGELKGKEDFLFRKRMQEDAILREGVETLRALQHVEIENFVNERASDVRHIAPEADRGNQVKIRPLPAYRHLWFRVAATVVVITGIGLALWNYQKPTPDTLTVRLPVRTSADGSLGWAPGLSAEEHIITQLVPGERGPLGYSFDHDTLRLFSALPLDKLSKDGKLYLVDDLRNRRLVLVIESKKYAIVEGTKDILLLKEIE